MHVKKGSIEERILNTLRTKYPITVEDVRNELRLNPRILNLSLKRLERSGIIDLEHLPDKTYIRLTAIQTT